MVSSDTSAGDTCDSLTGNIMVSSDRSVGDTVSSPSGNVGDPGGEGMIK